MPPPVSKHWPFDDPGYQEALEEFKAASIRRRQPAKSESTVFNIAMIAGAVGLAIGTCLPGNRGGLGFVIGFAVGFIIAFSIIVLPYLLPTDARHRRYAEEKFSEELASSIIECPHCGSQLRLRRSGRELKASELKESQSYGS